MAQLTDLVDDLRPRRVSLGRAGLCTLVFLGVLAAGTTLLRHSGPLYLRSEPLRSKLEHFARHKDRYDTIFVGSSHVYRQVLPEVFDAVTAQHGHPTRSFNAGVPGMQGLETEFVLEQILAMAPKRLRWVWIDPGDPYHLAERSNQRTERFEAWHDPRRTRRALDLVLSAEAPRHDPDSWLRAHLGAMLRRLLNVGRGVTWLETLGRGRAEPPPEDWDGYQSLESRLAHGVPERHEYADRRTRFLTEPAAYREQVQQLIQEVGTRQRSLEPEEERFFGRLVGSVESAGGQAIFLVPPILNARREYLIEAAARGIVPVTFSYTDPVAHPDLYDPTLRFDGGHLSVAGSRRFSSQLARDFVRHARAEQKPGRSEVALRTGSR